MGEIILLVEDDAEVREVTAFMVETMGYAVLTAESGPAALGVLAEAAVDVLLTDITMPGGMNGYELADEARRRRPEVSVICMTGYSAVPPPEGAVRHLRAEAVQARRAGRRDRGGDRTLSQAGVSGQVSCG